MSSSPSQASEAAGQAYSLLPCQFDPVLFDFDHSETSSREASVEVLDDPTDQDTQSEAEDIKKRLWMALGVMQIAFSKVCRGAISGPVRSAMG